MAIEETVTVVVASVEVNDEYRVELSQFRAVTDYSPDEAMKLAQELSAAGLKAAGLIQSQGREVASRGNARGITAGEIL